MTAALNFNQSKAILLGKQGEGFPQMLHVMNHARVSTASFALGGCEAAFRIANEYAHERETMGQAIAHHPMIHDYLKDMDVTTKGIRSLLYECLFHEDMDLRIRIQLKKAKGVKKTSLQNELQHHYWRARLLTPLVKYFAAEEAVRLSRMAIQILGGVGFMQEYHLGRFHTDSLLTPIYEGTSQIQSLMVLKDRLTQAMRNPTEFVKELASASYPNIVATDPIQRHLKEMKRVYYQFLQAFILDALSGKVKSLTSASFKDISSLWTQGWDPKKSFTLGLRHAERFTKVTTYMEVGELLATDISQATSQDNKDWRRQIALNFFAIYENRSKALLAELKADKEPILPKVFGNSLMQKA